MTRHLPRARVAGASVLGASLLALPLAPAHAAGPTPGPPAATRAAVAPTVLEPEEVLALAGDGTAVAWLRGDRGADGSGPLRVSLWTWDGTGAPRRIAAKGLPSRTSDLAIGDDAAGRRTIVLAAGGTSRTGPTRLYAVPADDGARPRRLRASLPGGAESAPGLHDGVLSFTRQERTRRRGAVHATVRLGSLTSSRSRLVSDGERGTAIESTVPTARDGVAYVTARENGAGASYALRVLRAGGRSTVLSRTSFGGASQAGFGPLTVSGDGRVLTATRWVTDGGGHPADRTRYRVPAGTRIGRPAGPEPGEVDLAVPVRGGTVYVDGTLPAGDDPTGQLVFRPAG